MKKCIVLTLSITLISSVFADELRDKYYAEYEEIISLVESSSWETLKAYETKYTKCGFGPNEEGLGCIENLLSSSQECKEKILSALYQGCKLVQEGKKTRCFAPPQSIDSDVIYPSQQARVMLGFVSSDSQVTIESIICAGD